MDSDSDLDDLLDSVLDDFDDTATDTESEASIGLAPEPMARPDPAPAHMDENLDEIMKQLSDSSFGQELQRLMESEGNSPAFDSKSDNNSAGPTPDDLNMLQEMMKGLHMGMDDPSQAGFGSVRTPAAQPKSFQEGLDAAMEMISDGSRPISSQPSADEDAFFDKLLDEFKGMDPDDEGSMDEMMEKMMAEMLSKDSLLPPLRQVVEMVCPFYF